MRTYTTTALVLENVDPHKFRKIGEGPVVENCEEIGWTNRGDDVVITHIVLSFSDGYMQACEVNPHSVVVDSGQGVRIAPGSLTVCMEGRE